MWKIEEVLSAIQTDSTAGISLGKIELGLWDESSRIGIGKANNDRQVLVFPGAPDVAAFDLKYGKFDPFVSAAVLASGEKISGTFAILDCNFEENDQFQMSTLAGVFSGLIEVQKSFGNAGLSIWSMKRIFEKGFTTPELDKITGLIGELVLICLAPDKNFAVKAWHSQVDATYDFSFGNKRIEVKSTKGNLRAHHFGSNQLPAKPQVDLKVASVLVPPVEVGNSLQDLYEKTRIGLTDHSLQKLNDQIIRTIGIPAAAVSAFTFDLDAALDSVYFYNSQEVPTPQVVPGVLSMSWESDLTNCSVLEGVEIWEPRS